MSEMPAWTDEKDAAHPIKLEVDWNTPDQSLLVSLEGMRCRVSPAAVNPLLYEWTALLPDFYVGAAPVPLTAYLALPRAATIARGLDALVTTGAATLEKGESDE